MNRRRIVIGTVLVIVGLPVVLILALYSFFYAVFYFPNRTPAVTSTLTSSGVQREYLLYVPKSYDPAKPTPLVITLHTSMSWPTSAMNISQWNSVADEQGFIAVYPAGTGYADKSWEMAGSESPTRMPDVIFISDLINKLAAAYSIDRARIYVNGMSNGGGMAFVLSCTLSDRIAAIGMISAGLDPGWSWCPNHRPLPVIAFHGTADPILPYNGGKPGFGDGSLPSVPSFMATWAQRNQCAVNPIESSVARDVMRIQYTNCADEADVVLYTIKGGGHQWPGGKPIVATWLVGPYSRSIDATRQMWAFFREHRLPNK